MALVIAKNTPKPIARKSAGNMAELQDFRHHQQHDKTAIGVNGDVSNRNLWRRNRRRTGDRSSFVNSGSAHVRQVPEIVSPMTAGVSTESSAAAAETTAIAAAGSSAESATITAS